MISVFRIYLGRAWFEHEADGRLRDLFDTLPEFLHTPMIVGPGEAESAELTPEARRAAIRVAMTQAHVAIMWGGKITTADAWTTHEIHIARTGFRRRIPILSVTPPEGGDHETLAVRAADRVERWQAMDIAYAVQELAESSAAERRILLRQLALEAQASIPATLSSRELSLTGATRHLPTSEIADAFASLQTSRIGAPTNKGSA